LRSIGGGFFFRICQNRACVADGVLLMISAIPAVLIPSHGAREENDDILA
jgi:hypothetical protein